MIDNKDIITERLSNLKINENNKKKYGEVFTPRYLINEMLDKLPKEVWSNKELKWFDPAVGIGNFMIEIYWRLMENIEIPDFNERKSHILRNMLYMSELNEENIKECKKIFGEDINIYEGDTLQMPNKYFPIDKFDIIVGNPPYQLKVGEKKTQPIWNLFTNKFIDELNKDGYLLFIHPSGWRNIDGVFRNVFDKIKSKKLIYLNMNDFKRGQEIFKVGTNFDYYLLQNEDKPIDYKTTINDIDDKLYEINIDNWEFIPSGKFELYRKILALNKNDRVNIMHSYSMYETRKNWISSKNNDEAVKVYYSRSMYGTDKSWVSSKNNDTFKYPCCYSITQKDGLKLYYSNADKGHFNVPKVIWSNGLGTYPIVDKIGEYGLTQFCYAIVDDIENLEKIEKAMNSKKFISLMNYVKFTNNKYNYKVIGLFKKKFYKEFI